MDHPDAVVEAPVPAALADPAPDATMRLDVALAASPGGLLHRRGAAPMLELRNEDPADFLLLTPWYEFSGDLGKGLVLQAARRPEAGQGPTVCHSGNILEFRHRGRAVSLDVEAHIAGAGIARFPGRVVLWHESRFPLQPRRRGPFARRAAAHAAPPAVVLRHAYTVFADSPVLHLTVSLRPDPGIELAQPCVTTALDDLSPGSGEGGAREGGGVRRALVWTGEGRGPATTVSWPKPAAATEGSGAVDLLGGPASHIALPSDGDAPLTCHLRLVDGERLRSVKGTARADSGRLHWAVLRYGAAALGPGEPMVVREERLLVPATPDTTPQGADEAGLALAPLPDPAPRATPEPRPPSVFLGDRVLAWTHRRRRIFLVPDDIDLTPCILEDGRWEPQVEQALGRLLRPGMAAADVGANIGYHSLVMADAVGPAGQVHAFEADPALAALLRTSVAANGLGGTVAVHGAVALLDRVADEVVLATAPGRSGSGHVVPDRVGASHSARYPRRVGVPGTTLDVALARARPLDLLRMDVEGAEPLVLRGAAATIARSPGLRILTEWSVPMMASRTDPAQTVAFLTGFGFRAWLVEPDARLSPLPADRLPGLPHSEVLFARSEPGGG